MEVEKNMDPNEYLREFRKSCATPVMLLRHIAQAMATEMQEGLDNPGQHRLKMLPTYLECLPSGCVYPTRILITCFITKMYRRCWKRNYRARNLPGFDLSCDVQLNSYQFAGPEFEMLSERVKEFIRCSSEESCICGVDS